MTPVSRSHLSELHPEDLLERDARGELSPLERTQLDVHLARCAACRLERLARADFLRETEDDARRSPADVPRLLAGVLDVPRPAATAVPRARRQRLAALLLTGVLVTIAGWAAAARWSGTRPAASLDATEAPTSARRTTPALSGAARGETAPVVVRDVPEEQATATPPAWPASNASPATPVPSVPHLPVAPASPPPAAASPGLAFQLANEARRAGQHAHAAEGYRALVAKYPGSAEASASLVALGRMLLDDGDAPGALECFDGYLRRGGAEGEDVMLGRALALQHLGRRDDESGAWSALLASYPGSVHAARARRRLTDLGKM